MSRLLVFILSLLVASDVLAAARITHHDLVVHLDPAAHRVAITDRLSVDGSGDVAVRLNALFGTPRVLGMGGGIAQMTGPEQEGMTHWRLSVRGRGRRQVLLSYEATLPDTPDPGAIEFRRSLSSIPIHAGQRGTFFPEETGWVLEDDQEKGFTYTAEITTPIGQEAIVPGDRISRTATEDGIVTRYRADWPARGVSLMAGPYQIREARAGEVRLYTYLHPEIASVAEDYLEAVRRYIELYSKKIGPYPFGQFSVVSSPLPTGFGFPAMTLLGIDVIRLPFIKDTSLGHEVLHNWWGNSVYPDYATGNWSEALTTYMADYFFKEQKGEEAAREMRLEWIRSVAAYVRESDDIPLSRFTVRTESRLRAIGYNKGAFVFHLLRREIGDEAFYGALRQLYQDRRFQTVSWNDLRMAFEKTSKKPLGEFFKQWVERPGLPRLTVLDVESSQNAGKPGEPTDYTLRLTLAQEGPPFVLPVPVRIITKAGTEERKVLLAAKEQRFNLALKNAPVEVSIDPDVELFRAPDPGENPPILAKVFGDPAAEVWIPAADDSETRRTLSALAEGLFEKPRVVGPPRERLPDDHAVVILGTTAMLKSLIPSRLTLPSPPDVERTKKWDVRVTALEGPGNRPILMIEGKSVRALTGVGAKLPHYGSYSYLAFEDGQNIEKGIWPSQQRALRKTVRMIEPAAARIHKMVEELSSPRFAGRRTGTAGGQRAAEWVARKMGDAGLLPAGSEGWYSPFAFEVRSIGKGSVLRLGNFMIPPADWLPWIWSGSGHATGLLDAERKKGDGTIWVVPLSGPLDEAAMASLVREAQERGAGALLIGTDSEKVANPLSVWPARFPADTVARWKRRGTITGPEFYDMQAVAYQSRIPKPEFTVRIPVAFVRADRLQGQSSTEVRLDIERWEVRGKNVVGIAGPPADPPSVLLGAHFDHLGVYAAGPAFPGADDNASGVAVLLEAARRLGEHPPARPILFVAFDAEEWGLRGSAAFAARPSQRMDGVRAVITLDAVGRNEPDALHFVGASRSPDLYAEAVPEAREAGLRLLPDIEFAYPYGSDHYPFYLAGLPSVDLTSSYHADFHQPTDTAEKVDAEKLGRAADFLTGLARRLADSDAPSLLPPIPADVPFPAASLGASRR